MNYKQNLTAYVRAILSGLKDYGVSEVVISPGSRSTPLAYGVVSDQDFSASIQVDERSAAFYALGLAKASGKSVALICTSGSAAANYFPAIVEAYYARIPLIVLTADRPHELREVGAPQTIDQVKMYGTHVKWAIDYPVVDSFEGTTPFVYSQTTRAVLESCTNPRGPVHLNIPFREPLLLDFEMEIPAKREKMLDSTQSVLSEQMRSQLTTIVEQAKSGIVIVGELALSKVSMVEDYLADLGWPVLCDPLSNLRSSKHPKLKSLIIENYDALLKNDMSYETLLPDVVIRIGPQPVSKFLGIFLKTSKPTSFIVVDEAARFRDPLGLATETVVGGVEALVGIQTAQSSDHKSLAIWQVNNVVARELVHAYREDEQDEGAYIATVFGALPEDAVVFASSSMPIRDVDTFHIADSKGISILANRGTNGIDGVVSTALGAQKALEKPLYLLIGDLAFLHDANGLLLSRYQHVEATIIVMNNDGGGIFSYLPQASEPEYFEKLFGTGSGITFKYLADMYSIPYVFVESKEQLSELVSKPSTGLRILEVTTNRQANTETHRKLWKRVKESWTPDV
ncbi:2-succinyl-5-enolpyruvyl-6-hydroxy-3-cyclohexene-1-carboxylic-acid synthase [Chryseomicrobium aureum]|uniref:2-succinyl-5-enolpyruvyl-6-hydroxy-3- cyclohexene-1-carboxylic-acid synthase n=1 Tax=Chryseomicrobium aureum TaxID=1441723 RepID=UPI00370D9A9D